ncbi:MAG: hypothetical protein KF752_04035 [Pirellulaceae bacterium]|nr:hypothetical protein [Pirellulaceae bacterium]
MESIDRVLIVGCGWVGRQVGARLAMHGLHVALTDKSAQAIAAARQWMSQCDLNQQQPLRAMDAHASRDEALSVSRSSSDPLRSWLQRITLLPTLTELTQQELADWQPDLALECVPEQLSLKKRVLRQLSQLLPERCIIASNTSYFVPSVLSQFVSQPARYAQLHFHVPVLRQSVADIVGCDQTHPQVLQRIAELAGRIDQYPLILRREHPGYVFNWLLQAVLKASLELVALDVVDPEDVDRSWTAVTGMSVGPFGMMDQIGLDVIDQVLSNARWATPPSVTDQQLLQVLRPLLEQGKLGAKSGAGFYDYKARGK